MSAQATSPSSSTISSKPTSRIISTFNPFNKLAAAIISTLREQVIFKHSVYAVYFLFLKINNAIPVNALVQPDRAPIVNDKLGSQPLCELFRIANRS